MSNLYFTICGLFCSILIVILFFSKDKINSPETRIYGIMAVSGLIDTMLVTTILLIAYINYNPTTLIIIKILNKIDFIHYVLWPSLAFLYTFYISYNNINLYEKVKKIVIFLDIILIFIDFFLPIEAIKENNIMGIVGPGANFVYVIALVYIFLIFIMVLTNIKKGSKQKYIPLAVLVLLLIVASIIRVANPTLLIIPAILVYINLIMYFTIENPDVKMIEELTKAQKLSQDTTNEKSNFLYTVTEEINEELNKVEKIYNDVLELNPEEEIKEYMYDLKDVVNTSRTKIKQTIDISEMDNKHLQVTNNKYNVRLLFNSLYSSKKSEIIENIDFRMNISEDIPEELYGDSIKLKQIITTVLDNSIKYTNDGFIELRVSSIIKNDMCRLIIALEDSGSGINIYKQNEIMSNTGDLTKEEIESLDDMNLNLKVIRKMISIIGGTFTIDTNKYNGTTINITLDQKIYENEKSKEERQIEKYSEVIKNQKRVAIVSLNKNNIATIKNACKKSRLKVEEFNVTKNLLDLLRSNEKYVAIFIEEDMEKIDARSLLAKTKQIEGFNAKIFVITKNKEIRNKKELLSIGFTGIIYSPVEKKDIINKLENL